MFRRRTKLSWVYRLRSFIWPHAGWRRSTLYVAHRIGRMPGKPHGIAAGLAAGVAISFLPLNGAHLALGAVLAYLTRGSIVASAIGTLAGNPWTFPFIWIGTYRLGAGIAPGDQIDRALRTGDFVRLFADMVRAVLAFDPTLFVERVWPVWWPMMIGSLPLALLSWIVTYAATRMLVERYQAQRRERRLSRPPDTAMEQPPPTSMEDKASAPRSWSEFRPDSRGRVSTHGPDPD